MASISLLNLDQSYPIEDLNNLTNTAGTIRFITGADARNLASLQRLQNDLVHRFHLSESKINEVIALINDQPVLSSFDNTPYVLTNGSHPFTAPINGVAPTASAHLSTRGYVDAVGANLASVFDALSDQFTTLQAATPKISRSNWTVATWSAGVKQFLDLTLNPTVTNMDRLLNLTLLERLNVGEIGTPIYKYRQLMHGTLGGTSGSGTPGAPAGDGIHVDDFWLQNDATVRVLLPSVSSYPTGYASGADYNLRTPAERHLRAVIFESQS